MDKIIRYYFEKALLLLLIIASFNLFSCNAKEKIVCLQEINIMEFPEAEETKGNKIVAVLRPGDECEILDVTYSKDYAFYRVKTKDGKVGYILGDSEKMRRIPNDR